MVLIFPVVTSLVLVFCLVLAGVKVVNLLFPAQPAGAKNTMLKK